MKYHQKMFILAILVVLCFVFSAIIISYRNYWLFALSLLLGFALMGYGLKQKKIYYSQEEEG
ncbi:DUF5325 family protein [Bacillaceae bacterium W0354]